MTRFGKIFVWLWLAGVGVAYSIQFKDYAGPLARLIRGLGS